MTKRLVIIGDSLFAEVAYEYFGHDSPYEVKAFSVEQAYLKHDTKFGLPVFPFESLEKHAPPDDYDFFVAMVYTQLNWLRTWFYEEAKRRGYTPASYISSRAFVWRNTELGEHCFIFENNTIQPFVKVGNNVVMWSGNHIGHHAAIGDNVFISSHVVISGSVKIGDSCFLGVNSTIVNDVTVGARCVIGAGALVLADVPANTTVVGVWK